MKKVLIAVGMVLLLLVSTALALPFLVDLNKYQDQYRPLIENALNRKVALKDIRLTVWPRIGASVAECAVMEDPAFGTGPFASLASLDVGVKLLPLLSGKVEVDTITLREPVVTVIKNSGGVLNLSTLGPQPPPAPAGPEAPPEESRSPLHVLALLAVEHVAVTEGKLTYRDETAPVPAEYALEALELEASRVRLGQTPSLHLAATVQPWNLPVALDGTAGPLVETLDLERFDLDVSAGKTSVNVTGSAVGGVLNATLSAPEINTAELPVTLPLAKPVLIKGMRVAAATPYPLPEDTPLEQVVAVNDLELVAMSGSSGVNLKGSMVGGIVEVLATAHSLRLEDIPVALPLDKLLGQPPAKSVMVKNLRLEATARYPFPEGVPLEQAVTVKDLELAVESGGSTVSVKGTLAGGHAEVTATAPLIRTEDLPVSLPLAKPVLVKNLRVAATASLPLKEGTPIEQAVSVKDLQGVLVSGSSAVTVKGGLVRGSLSLAATAPSIRSEDIPISLPIGKPFQVKDLQVTAKAKYPFKEGTPALELADVPTLTMAVLLGNSTIQVKGQVQSGKATLAASSPALTTADLPVDLPVNKPVAMNNLQVAAELKGQEARVTALTVQVFGGQVNGQGRMALDGDAPPFSGKIALAGLQIGPVLETVGTGKVWMSGAATGNLDLQGRGFTMPELRKSLKGTAQVALKDGNMEGVNVLQEALALLKVAGLIRGEAKATVFSTLEADANINEGVIRVNKLLVDSHDFQGTATGTVGFDQTLNLQADLSLPEGLSRKVAGSSPVANFVLGGKRLTVPLRITGSTTSPSFALDAKAFAAQAQERVKEKVEEAVKETVEDVLKGKTRPEDLKRKGEDLLKGLFGK